MDKLLARLKDLDGETWMMIDCAIDTTGYFVEYGPRDTDLDHIQGTIQRACEKRGWRWKVTSTWYESVDKKHSALVVTKIYELDYKECFGSTAAEALLRAYISALESEIERIRKAEQNIDEAIRKGGVLIHK